MQQTTHSATHINTYVGVFIYPEFLIRWCVILASAMISREYGKYFKLTPAVRAERFRSFFSCFSYFKRTQNAYFLGFKNQVDSRAAFDRPTRNHIFAAKLDVHIPVKVFIYMYVYISIKVYTMTLSDSSIHYLAISSTLP